LEGEKMNIISRPLILIVPLAIWLTACSRAPEPIIFEFPRTELAKFNGFLDSSKDYNGPIFNCIHLSDSNNTLAYSLNEKPMTKEQFEIAIENMAAIDSNQTLVIEFGDGTSVDDLADFTSLKSFLLIGRKGKDPKSVRVLKELSNHSMCQ
jgi:hypothetical protein